MEWSHHGWGMFKGCLGTYLGEVVWSWKDILTPNSSELLKNTLCLEKKQKFIFLMTLFISFYCNYSNEKCEKLFIVISDLHGKI